MNDFYDQHNIPLDFVYTAKMMFGVFDLVKKNHFNEGSKILCIHTGGLQGNNSLPVAGHIEFLISLTQPLYICLIEINNSSLPCYIKNCFSFLYCLSLGGKMLFLHRTHFA